MKVTFGEHIEAKNWRGKVTFLARSDEVVGVSVLAYFKYNRHPWLAKLLPDPIVPWWLKVETDDQTLNVHCYDPSFEPVRRWLIANGWRLEEAETKAIADWDEYIPVARSQVSFPPKPRRARRR